MGGWLQIEQRHGTRCQAPLTYDKCKSVQDFSSMAATEKEEWQHLCEQNFPCLSRAGCEKDWLSPCPAGLYVIDGALACVAPNSYTGTCPSELRGIVDYSVADKRAISLRCGVSWPCKRESFGEYIHNAQGVVLAQGTTDAARYVLRNGAISSLDGVVGAF